MWNYYTMYSHWAIVGYPVISGMKFFSILYSLCHHYGNRDVDSPDLYNDAIYSRLMRGQIPKQRLTTDWGVYIYTHMHTQWWLFWKTILP